VIILLYGIIVTGPLLLLFIDLLFTKLRDNEYLMRYYVMSWPAASLYTVDRLCILERKKKVTKVEISGLKM
jgi:hypothetical protein